MDVEEGELTSSDEESKDLELENVDYNVLERPKILPTSCPMNRPSIDILQGQGINDYDDVGLSSSESDNSSDDGHGPTRSKKRMAISNARTTADGNFINPNMDVQNFSTSQSSAVAMDSNSFEGRAAQFQTGRKKINNIWGEVLREQSVSSTADDLGLFMVGGEDAQVFKRGPESFVIEGKLKRKYKEEGEGFDAPFEEPDSDESFSSTALSDNSKEYIVCNYLDSKPKDKDNSTPKKKKFKERLRAYTLSMTDDKFCNFVANQLEERKASIISNVVKYLGREVALHLFSKSLLIEKRGGILIKNGVRRRTPGGVFLYLLRNNPNFSRDVVSQIFDEGDAEHARVCIEAKRRKKPRRASALDKELNCKANDSSLTNLGEPDSGEVDDMS